MKRTTQLLGAVSAFALVAMSSAPAIAQGTDAGSTIRNSVSVTYRVNDILQDAETASDTFTVDRRVDVVVAAINGTTAVTAGETEAVVQFTVTNLSNDTIDYQLFADETEDDLSNLRIFVEDDGVAGFSNGDTEIDYLDGMAADETRTIYVLGDIASVADNGDTYDVVLTADARDPTGSVASPGVDLESTSTANTAGVDTVLADGASGVGTRDTGPSDGAFAAVNSYVVAAADVAINKTSRILSDPINTRTPGGPANPNAKAIPGAEIEYCITVANAAGAAEATAVNVVDLLPADVTFTAGDGIFVDQDGDCAGGTDEEGGAASFDDASGPVGEDRILATLPNIPAATTRSLYFIVTID
ncbi:MAG: hypothetical protein V2J51_02450 [Erythrobacter sp.]|jgi:uncharacterized repeat protein (TIGR01451 family)|nr:hypothetical protein [Erythrobacter sp.]